MDLDRLKEATQSFANKTKDTAIGMNELRKKSNKESKIKLKNTVVRKDIEGSYYLSNSYDENLPRYSFERIEFQGSQIKTKTTGDVKKQSRVGSAITGGLIMGPIGGIAGASRKRKDKINSTTVQEEKPGKGIVHLRNKETNEIKKIKFLATQSEFLNIERFFL